MSSTEILCFGSRSHTSIVFLLLPLGIPCCKITLVLLYVFLRILASLKLDVGRAHVRDSVSRPRTLSAPEKRFSMSE
jgi:hypothetical protein